MADHRPAPQPRIDVTRYLELQARGAAQWLSSPPVSSAQKVVWGLLQMPHAAPLVPAELASRFDLEVAEFSRALFELNRSQALQVIEQAQDHAEHFVYDFELLRADLRLLGTGTPQLMLASADGLCLAQHGLPEDVCMRQAVLCHHGASQEFPSVLPLYLGERAVHLCSPGAIDASNSALLRLARRMIGLQQALRRDA